jgi:citrate lyase gamma subunit
MALERKDVRFKIDPADHRRLDVVVEHDEKDLGEWVEQLVLRELARREAAARRESSLLVALERAGISRKSRDLSGSASGGGGES